MATLEMILRGFPLWVVVLALMSGLYRDAGSGGIFRGSTVLWLLVLTMDLGLVLALLGMGLFLEGFVLTPMVHARSMMRMRNVKMRARWEDAPLVILTKQYR